MSDRHTRALDKLAAALGPAFENGDVDLAKATIVSCCDAKRRVRAGKGPDGAYLYEDEPDFPVRLAAAVKIIEWTIGKPVARSIQTTLSPCAGAGGANSQDELLNLLLAAPEAAADIVRKLQEAAAKARRAEAIDVTTS